MTSFIPSDIISDTDRKQTMEIRIRPLPVDLIPPSYSNCHDVLQGGSKIVVIGKPGTGKTTLITSLLYEKSGIFPVAMVMSGTEDSNGHYRKLFPSTFVYNRMDEKKLEDFVTRQKVAKSHLPNPWAVLLLDDCTDDPKIFNKPLFQSLYKNGRHWKLWFILSLQYCMDIKPVIRTNIDGTFILRESNLRNRKVLWENYAGIIPDFTMFCAIMDQITDNYTALYIHNATQSNNLEDCVFWYRARPVPADFRFGSNDFWRFHKQRYDNDYKDAFL
ncbi:AAA family ATPase [bacterium]|nr:AAA family ATPase [bacterium]